MIIDHISNAHAHPELGGNITAALLYLQTMDLLSLAPGKYEIQGSIIFAIADQYMTKPKEEGRLETHRRYIDVQYVAQGEELIGHAPASALTSWPYDRARDVQFHEGPAEFHLLGQGMFAVMLPVDAHMPGIAAGTPQRVKKVVVKVAVT